MSLSQNKIEIFKQKIWEYYRENKRDLPWRHTTEPYKIMVSEIILQQTQVSRGLIKYPEFIKAFPNVEILAKSSLTKVLRVWLGLGYNRRAKYLKEIAEIVLRDYQGKVPTDPNILGTFPGIGPNTAAAIAVYSANVPVAYIETNIRKIFLDEFFPHVLHVSDADLMPLIKKTLDSKNPREWYWALMDYGAYLSKVKPNPNLRSKHYVKQSKYNGSSRELRSKVLKILSEREFLDLNLLKSEMPDSKLPSVLESLEKEGFVVITDQCLKLRS